MSSGTLNPTHTLTHPIKGSYYVLHLGQGQGYRNKKRICVWSAREPSINVWFAVSKVLLSRKCQTSVIYSCCCFAVLCKMLIVARRYCDGLHWFIYTVTELYYIPTHRPKSTPNTTGDWLHVDQSSQASQDFFDSWFRLLCGNMMIIIASTTLINNMAFHA